MIVALAVQKIAGALKVLLHFIQKKKALQCHQKMKELPLGVASIDRRVLIVDSRQWTTVVYIPEILFFNVYLEPIS